MTLSLALALCSVWALAQQHNVRRVDDYLYVSLQRLVIRPDVQKEIALSPTHIQALAKAAKAVDVKEAAEKKMRADGKRYDSVIGEAITARVFYRKEAMRIVDGLTPAQDTRLTQLCVQLDAENLLLFSYAIRGKLRMDDAQMAKMRAAMAAVNKKMAAAMRPPPGTPPAKNPEAARKERAAKMAAMAGEKMKAMTSVFTPAQQKIWEAAKGKPFGK